MYVAVNVPVNTRCIGVPDKLLAWLNKCLRTSLTKVEQLCTGVTYCLLMDRLFPGILDLSEVRSRSNNTTDSIYNFSLLEDAFRTVGVLRYVPTEALMQSNPAMSLAFLQWFKLFFDQNNHNGGQYKAPRNTEGQTIATDDTGGVPAQTLKPVEVENMEESNQEKEMPKENLQGCVPSQTPKPVEVENIEVPSKEKEMLNIEMESPVKSEETPIKDKHTPKENVSKNDDVIVLISDDDDDFVDVTSEENTVTMETTTTTTNTTPTVNVETRVLVVNNMPQPAALVVTAAAVDNTTQRDSRSGDNMLSFVKRYCTNNGDTDSDSMATILGQTVPKDIVEGCYRSPYCLYLYMGVEVVGGDSTSVVLIGYLDLSSGVTVVRLLNTLQMSLDMGVDIVAGASTDAQFLIDMLKMNYFPLNNLAVFYCNATDQQVGRVFMAQLRAFNPRLISLCGVPGMAARACQAGLTAAFPSVVDLIQSIHRHYSTSSFGNGTLKALFSPQEAYKPSQPIATQCLFIINTVQKMVSTWRELVDYFKSLGADGERIRAQLMCYKVRLHFLFLSHTLEPLRALQELQQYGRVELTMELQLISMLLNCYATSLLTPEVAERFLRELNPRVLPLIKQVLPMTERNIGPAARDFLWASSVADLGEKDRRDFQQNAVTFYKVALSNLVESIPKQLGDLAMRNIGKVLKNPVKIDSTKPHYEMVGQLGVNLGLFEARSHDRMQLYQDYKYFIEKMKQTNRTGKDLSWGKMLQGIRPYSNLRRLLLILLALPDTLRQTQVFDKMFSYKVSPKAPAVHDKPEVTPPKDNIPTAATPRNYPTVTKGPVQAVTKRPLNNQSRYREDKMEDETDEDDSSATEDSEDFNPQISRRKRYGSTDESNDTDNSSDVIEVVQKSKMCQIRRLPGSAHSQVKEREKGQTATKTPQAESVYVVGEDDSDEEMVSASTPPRSTETLKRKIQTSPSRMSNVTKGDLVWAQVEGFSPWPAVVIDGGTEAPGKKMVDWYGQNMSSQVSIQTMKPFSTFSRHFCSNSFAILATYREAIYMSLQEASLRCRKEFSAFDEDREELVKEMLDWAFGGFNPSGPEGLKQAADTNGFVRKPHSRPKVKKKSFLKANSSPHGLNSTAPVNKPIHPELQDKLRLQPTVKLNNINYGGKNTWEQPFKLAPKVPKLAKEKPAKPAWDREKEYRHSGWDSAKAKGGGWKKKKKISLSDRYDNDVSPDFVPAKKRNYNKVYNKMADKENVYRQPDQHLRDEIIRRIMDMKLDIDGFCLCCGTEDVEIFHPLFKGSLCSKCKDNLTETLYRYDEDGYQSYCTICCYGMEVILCGNDSCCRSYCEDCLNVLVAPGMFDSLKVLDPWICYLCQPHRAHGALTPREDWSIRVQNLFANNSAMEFEPHRVYPSIPANMRRPLRVLSLFDGIATGLVVLKELGFKVEKYVASEVCDDSLAVATINHDGKIIHVGDVRRITLDLLEEWGPFDLLIGGSPCNDLSIVNPIRKGLYEGTGRLFFEYYRILQLLKPKEEDPRPFFWLFENVVFMNTHDKVNICRFLECNPVLVNAVKVSPAHRARCFWGNIPGMSRPITASQTDKLTLQECLEIGREARVTKVRTITTNPNSLKQGSMSQLPVLQNGKEDNLWITELERIFGFPKHYTDVRNMNRQQRQKVLGKAWSVPVIRHLFAPLKDYFSCEELPPLSNNINTANALSSSSSSAPDSPDLLR